MVKKLSIALAVMLGVTLRTLALSFTPIPDPLDLGNPLVFSGNDDLGSVQEQVPWVKLMLAKWPDQEGPYRDFFSITGSGTSGTWSYTPSGGEVIIDALVLKAGNAYTIWVPNPFHDGSGLDHIAWDTRGLVNGNGKSGGKQPPTLRDMSHISWYGHLSPLKPTDEPTAVPVPDQGATALMLVLALVGAGVFHARSHK